MKEKERQFFCLTYTKILADRAKGKEQELAALLVSSFSRYLNFVLKYPCTSFSIFSIVLFYFVLLSFICFIFIIFFLYIFDDTKDIQSTTTNISYSRDRVKVTPISPLTLLHIPFSFLLFLPLFPSPLSPYPSTLLFLNYIRKILYWQIFLGTFV